MADQGGGVSIEQLLGELADHRVSHFAFSDERAVHELSRLRAVRESRSDSAWRASLEAVSRAARDGGNLVLPVIAAVESMATVGEISDAMRVVFGEYAETATT